MHSYTSFTVQHSHIQPALTVHSALEMIEHGSSAPDRLPTVREIPRMATAEQLRYTQSQREIPASMIKECKSSLQERGLEREERREPGAHTVQNSCCPGKAELLHTTREENQKQAGGAVAMRSTAHSHHLN